MRTTNFDGTRYDYAADYLASLPKGQPLTIVDIGSGSSIVRERANAVHGDTLSFLEYDLFAKSENVTELDIEKASPGPQIADVVLMMDVVEHLWNPGQAMLNVAETLKPGGTLILTTPNPAWSKTRVMFPFADTINCFTVRDLESNHHVFTPWLHIVVRLLENCGFTVKEHTTLESELKAPNRPLSLSYPLRLFAWMAGKLIESTEPKSMGINYALRAVRKA